MKILFHGLNFSPEEVGIGKYSGEMVAELAGQGVDVCVVTTPPYYPHWKIAPGFSGTRYAREKETGERKQGTGSTKRGQLGKESSVVSRQSSDEGSKRGQDSFARNSPEGCFAQKSPDPFSKVEVIRCPLWVPARVNGVKRIVHLASFGLSSIPVVLWKAITTRPDVIMTVEPAAFCMPTTWLAARLCGAKAWLHVQDFEVDAAFELGIIRQPLMKRCVLAVEAFMMRRFDRVSSISPNMLMKLVQKGVDEDRLVAFPNWVDCDVMKPIGEGERRQETGDRLRRKFGIPTDKCVALYAGNIGAKQGLSIIVDAAKAMAREDSKRGQDSFVQSTRRASSSQKSPDPFLSRRASSSQKSPDPFLSPAQKSPDPFLPDVHFVICGDGAAMDGLRESAKGLANVQLLPVQPSECFNELMNCADMHLLPQRADAADLVMPSKLTGMLATGRPVVACASPGTQIADVVTGHGVVVPPGDVAAFCEAIEYLAQDPSLRQKLGQAARQYAVQYLGRESILSQFFRDLAELCAAHDSDGSPHRAGGATEDDEATRLPSDRQVPAPLGMKPPRRSEITNAET